MEAVFGYIIGLGAAVMMPIIFTILGVCIKIKFGKALQSGLYVGVGFVGLSVITALLTSSLSPSLSKVVEIYDLNLEVFDMGWPAAAAVAYNTSVGAFIIPVCLGVNILMLLTKTTKTVNIDLWNYWHFAFIGAMVYYTMDNIAWGFFAAVICYILTLIAADYTAPKFQKFYDKMDGISIPQPFCQGFMPFAILINKALDLIPGFNKLYIDAEGMKKKFGILGEPLFLGVLVGCGIGALACKNGQELVDGIPESQSAWLDIAYMKSGYGALLKKYIKAATEFFKEHILTYDKGDSLLTMSDVHSYFINFIRAGSRTSMMLRDALHTLDAGQSAENGLPPDPYRYEQRSGNGQRTYLGCPIPADAPPRPNDTAFWNMQEHRWVSQEPPAQRAAKR